MEVLGWYAETDVKGTKYLHPEATGMNILQKVIYE